MLAYPVPDSTIVEVQNEVTLNMAFLIFPLERTNWNMI